MKIRNGETPIKIPPIVKAGDPITARWANDLRDALQRLRDRVPVIKGASSGGASALNLPFEIYTGTEVVLGVTKPTINARDGVFDMTEFVDIKEVEPADGVWYLQAKAVIDLDTGAITERLVEFVDVTGVSDASTFYSTIGSIEVIDGIPDASTIIQSNYGPLFTLRYGGIDEKWAVIIY